MGSWLGRLVVVFLEEWRAFARELAACWTLRSHGLSRVHGGGDYCMGNRFVA